MGSPAQTHTDLAIIDLTRQDMKPGTPAWASTCQIVRTSLQEHGGFLALYQNIGSHLHHSVYSAMQDLFDLPLETKKRETSKKLIFSYSGQRASNPLYESVGIDNAVSLQHCQIYTQTMWPHGNHRFCESVNSYAKQVAELAKLVKRMVLESYGVGSEKCEDLLESFNYVLRCFKYRPPKMGENSLGLAPHTDTSFLTILHQKSDGLEIKLKDGEWVQIHASPSLFTILAGDAFTVWSNDRIRGCEHRVMMNSKTDRYCMGLLSYAEKILEPEEELVDEEHPLRYKPFDQYGYHHFVSTDERAFKSACRIKTYCGI